MLCVNFHSPVKSTNQYQVRSSAFYLLTFTFIMICLLLWICCKWYGCYTRRSKVCFLRFSIDGGVWKVLFSDRARLSYLIGGPAGIGPIYVHFTHLSFGNKQVAFPQRSGSILSNTTTSLVEALQFYLRSDFCVGDEDVSGVLCEKVVSQSQRL